MNYWKKMEEGSKRFTIIVTAITTIVILLGRISMGINKLTNMGYAISETLTASKEHTRYITYKIDQDIDNANKKLDNKENLSSDEIRMLINYRRTLPVILTDKQKNSIDLIESEYNRRSMR